MINPCPRCSRRDFIRLAIGASAAGCLASKFGLPTARAVQASPKAKRCILLWMQGAQSQIDTWDLKPGSEFGGPFREIETSAEGIRISEHLPRTARQMNKVSLIRTLNSRDPNHDTATYFLHTGYRQNSDLQHPHLGSVILEELGPGPTDLPGCIVLGGDPPAGAAYLPPERGPAIFDKLDNPTEDVLPSTEYFPKGTLEKRWTLLREFESDWNKKHEDARVEARERTYERAWKVLKSADLRAFDLGREPEAVRKAYGERPFGRAVLMARRLIQAGVRFVELEIGSWDSHADNFNAHQRLMDVIDGPYAALLEDLGRTGLLEETLVLLMSEFGRTPRINASKGRDHWTRNWAACLAGGGIPGGRVVGRTNATGTEIQERPVAVGDLFATVYRALGVDPEKSHTSAGGRPVKILEGGEPVKELF
ncbi:MAG TPA: DUF1501 domain-containing protein [Planctomycetota bacterium]|nr:DUF1501 domain-containing protein [Planctomycetota bacterium]